MGIMFFSIDIIQYYRNYHFSTWFQILQTYKMVGGIDTLIFIILFLAMHMYNEREKME